MSKIQTGIDRIKAGALLGFKGRYAQWKMGNHAYEAGNFAEAFEWYKMAADHHLFLAERSLAKMYQTGIGVPINQRLTLEYFKRAGLQGYGLEITETIPLQITPNKHNSFYLETKQIKMGHDLHIVEGK